MESILQIIPTPTIQEMRKEDQVNQEYENRENIVQVVDRKQ